MCIALPQTAHYIPASTLVKAAHHACIPMATKHKRLCSCRCCCVLQEVQQDELWLMNLRVLGPTSPAPGGMQLFKLPAPDAAAEGKATGRTQRGTAAAPPPAATLPIVRSVDVSLAAHIEGLAPQVGRQWLAAWDRSAWKLTTVQLRLFVHRADSTTWFSLAHHAYR